MSLGLRDISGCHHTSRRYTTYPGYHHLFATGNSMGLFWTLPYKGYLYIWTTQSQYRYRRTGESGTETAVIAQTKKKKRNQTKIRGRGEIALTKKYGAFPPPVPTSPNEEQKPLLAQPLVPTLSYIYRSMPAISILVTRANRHIGGIEPTVCCVNSEGL